MTLLDHLREIRQRVFKCLIAVAVGTVAGWMLFDQIFTLIKRPYLNGIAPLLRERGLDVDLTIMGIGGAFSFHIKIALVAGILIASPVLLWQFWAFVLPGMRKTEKRTLAALSASGFPLFVGGVCLGYILLPKGIEVLIGFAPDSVSVLLSLGDYLNFVLRTLLVFGVAAEIPLVVVLLNRLRIVSFEQLRSARPWTILGMFVFAAVATPSTDPLTMLLLGVPMCMLYGIAETIVRFADRKRQGNEPTLRDDEASDVSV